MLISIVSRILGWAAAAWTWAEIYELITGPLFSSSCSAAQLLDLENNEELNLKVSIIPAAVWLLVTGRRHAAQSGDQHRKQYSF